MLKEFEGWFVFLSAITHGYARFGAFMRVAGTITAGDRRPGFIF